MFIVMADAIIVYLIKLLHNNKSVSIIAIGNHRVYSIIKNLVLWARSESLGSADTGEDKIRSTNI